MGRPGAAVLVELDDGGSHHRTPRVGPQALDLALEAFGQRDVVGVEPRDIASAGEVEPAVERGCEAGLMLVPEHPEPLVGDRVEQRRRPIAGGVVDNDQLEIVQRLFEHAFDREADEALVVVDGEEDGHERHRVSVRP